ncbi:MAG: alpha/beta hydrolase [Pyrinomonadaceae bacterium]|jgi:pimeloyl-ACP methyl ester carboxylesterase|nr:alpha/beta hydrolase [Pyrinomonadaceae bacterium]
MKPNQEQSTIHNPQSAIVMVHGAFRGGWAWQKVRRILQQNGHEVFAPSLTGSGEKAHLLSPEITLETWIDDIVNLLNCEDLHNVVLVGHSQGGIVIQAVAEAITKRISKLVFIDAPVLQDSECAIDVLPKEVREKFGETPTNALIPPMPLQPNKYFIDKEIAWFNQRLTPVPTNPSLQKIRIERSANIPHQYIFCSQTPPFYPASYTRQRFDKEEVSYELIDAPHDCIWTHADLIAEMLETNL